MIRLDAGKKKNLVEHGVGPRERARRHTRNTLKAELQRQKQRAPTIQKLLPLIQIIYIYKG